MTQYIDKAAVVAKIKRLRERAYELYGCSQFNTAYNNVLESLDTLEVKEVDLYNNDWIDCTKQMPQETKQTSDTLQGHREWTESDMVLVWDSMYGCGIDSTRNGKWCREQRDGYTGQVVHGIIAWRPIPEFNEELL